MAIVVYCNRCGGELNEPGGLLFSPPNISSRSIKKHLCSDCWRAIYDQIRWYRDDIAVRRNDGFEN